MENKNRLFDPTVHILFSCILAPAAESYTIHLTAKEQNANTEAEQKGCNISHKEHYMIFSRRRQPFLHEECRFMI
ncbi:hypothetical protein BVY13_12345 [Bacillus amyloliquefaciens]|nr:hypothetical protein BVY13_12345 [Bacillus amyloliquefaciens]